MIQKKGWGKDNSSIKVVITLIFKDKNEDVIKQKKTITTKYRLFLQVVIINVRLKGDRGIKDMGSREGKVSSGSHSFWVKISKRRRKKR